MEVARCPLVVGREMEMTALRTALAQAEAAHGGVIVLAGEAGVGKSRLLSELAGHGAARDGQDLAGARQAG